MDNKQSEIDLKIKRDKQADAGDGLKIPRPQAPPDPFQQLAQKSRLYTRGGGIHYGVPPEERIGNDWWK